MLTPLSWLKEYVEIDCDLHTFIDAMTMSGSKVEGYEKLGEEIQNVVVGLIKTIEKHPDADKLVVTTVDVGENEPIQIVTGANNIEVGQYIPVALVGATLPGGIKIKKGKLRGVASHGMMCSIEELGFTKEDYPDAPENGIYIFDKPYPLGQDVKSIFGLDDVVIEYEITSNRPDCFSMIGIAREVAATFGKGFQKPEITVEEVAGELNAKVSVIDKELCPRYMAKVVKNVKVGPSPKWMRQRLMASGVRPINNIVDITNYVMLEMGQPMHAFDLDKLAGQHIIVRKANEGEKIQTLDGVERPLDHSMLVIADEERAVAIAGIMGGEETKVTESTQTILFESANFDGTSVRLSSKKLGLRTDSSSKFEKHIDPNLAEEAINRACQLIVLLGAGEVVEGNIDCYASPRKEKKLPFDADAINRLLGTDIGVDEMVKYLNRVECVVSEDRQWITVPTFRPDLERLADIAEEVARLYGYNNIPTTLPASTTVGKKSFSQIIEDRTRTIAEQFGFNEAMTYSFESPKVFDRLLMPEDDPLRQAIVIKNPLGEDFKMMRTTTLNGMLTSLGINYNRRNKDVRLYELGHCYLAETLPLNTLPEEPLELTLGMYGSGDFFDMKGVVETLFEHLGLSKDIIYDPKDMYPWLHPGRKATIRYEDHVLGYLGEVHPEVADNYEIGEKAYLAVIHMDELIKFASLDRVYEPLAKYPAVSRDVSVLVKDSVLVGEIEQVIKAEGGPYLEALELFDVYQGEQIEKGYKSVAYAITFRAKNKTLKEKEINKTMQKIITSLETKLHAELRS